MADWSRVVQLDESHFASVQAEHGSPASPQPQPLGALSARGDLGRAARRRELLDDAASKPRPLMPRWQHGPIKPAPLERTQIAPRNPAVAGSVDGFDLGRGTHATVVFACADNNTFDIEFNMHAGGGARRDRSSPRAADLATTLVAIADEAHLRISELRRRP
jgi:hypothetical protein